MVLQTTLVLEKRDEDTKEMREVKGIFYLDFVTLVTFNTSSQNCELANFSILISARSLTRSLRINL